MTLSRSLLASKLGDLIAMHNNRLQRPPLRVVAEPGRSARYGNEAIQILSISDQRTDGIC